MDFLARIQGGLEEAYGACTGVDVRDFVRLSKDLPGHGKLLIEQDSHDADINLAVLLDRDICAAWVASQSGHDVPLSSLAVSVPFEEVSHFVYISWNHQVGRGITALEMEMQSEVDRIWLAFHGPLAVSEQNRQALLDQLLHAPYEQGGAYENARRAAAAFVRSLSQGDPRAWTNREFARLSEFFHSDLARKFELARRKR